MTDISPRDATSRRHFLRTAALAAIAPAACGSLAAGPAPDNVIDAHVHVWTPDTDRYPLADGFTCDQMIPPSFTPEQLFAECRPHGVDRVVLIQMSFYGFDNRYLLDTIARFPQRFRGVAVIDPQQPDVGAGMRRLAAQGVRGLRLYADKDSAAAWSDSSAIQAIWTAAADAGLAICLLANPDALPAIQRMCARFPKTRVVIDHFARIGIDGTVSAADLDDLCRLADFDQTFVKTSAFYALGAKRAPYTDMAPMIRRLRDVYGGSRLMWATDCPYQLQQGHTYGDSLALVRDRLDFLTAEDKSWMLRKTAEQVFFA